MIWEIVPYFYTKAFETFFPKCDLVPLGIFEIQLIFFSDQSFNLFKFKNFIHKFQHTKKFVLLILTVTLPAFKSRISYGNVQ